MDDRPCRLAVRTVPSHGTNSGSNPGRVTGRLPTEREALGAIRGLFSFPGRPSLDEELHRHVVEVLAGADLDAAPPKKPRPQEPLEQAPRPAERDRELPGVDVSKPRPPVRPDEREPKDDAKLPPEPEPPPVPPPPKGDPREENARLTDLGIKAFSGREYGLAALRFRQATLAAPQVTRSPGISVVSIQRPLT